MPNTVASRVRGVGNSGEWRRAWRERAWNPIVVREGRARWRGARAFWLALGYAGFLSLVLWWNYAATQRYDSSGSGLDSFGRAAQMGHQLFQTLCMCQVGAWMLIAPALTAAALAGERERGLLEGLLLSHLSPAQIVRGKLLSAIGFIALLALAATPVLAVCFLLGGVSGGEMIGALVLQMAVATTGASLGLSSSAIHRKSSSAAGGAIGGVLAWLLLSGIALGLSSFSYTPVWSEVLTFVAASNPFLAIFALTEPLSSLRNASSVGAWGFLMGRDGGWLISLAAMGLLSWWRLRIACGALRRAPEKYDMIASGVTPGIGPASTSLPPGASSASRETAQRAAQFGAAVYEIEATPGHYWSVPVLRHVVFGNALLRRELRSAWRWPDPSVRAQIGLTFGGMLVGWLALQAVALIVASPDEGEGVWQIVVFLAGLAGTVYCATSPAASIARERASGVWQALSLSLLSPGQIAWAKVAAPTVAALGHGLPVWTLLGLAAWLGRVDAARFVGCAALVVLVWAQVASWSAVCGTRARTPAMALGWGLGGPLAAWAGVPILFSLFSVRLSTGPAPSWFELLHPALAFEWATRGNFYNAGIPTAFERTTTALILHAALAAALFGLALWSVRRSHQAERDAILPTS